MRISVATPFRHLLLNKTLERRWPGEAGTDDESVNTMCKPFQNERTFAFCTIKGFSGFSWFSGSSGALFFPGLSLTSLFVHRISITRTCTFIPPFNFPLLFRSRNNVVHKCAGSPNRNSGGKDLSSQTLIIHSSMHLSGPCLKRAMPDINPTEYRRSRR